jgi:hypothetical protein
MAKKGKKGMDKAPTAKGMSKLDDARKHCPAPIKGSGFANKPPTWSKKK